MILFLFFFSGVIQYLQFGYQKGLLYRLKALGERHDMDITIEGFHSWMWRGLSFLLPFLFGGYIFQIYNAYTLWQLSSHPEATWQVPALGYLFLILFIGNTFTTSMVIPQKMNERRKERYRLMSLSYALQSRQKIRGLRSESKSTEEPTLPETGSNENKTNKSDALVNNVNVEINESSKDK